MIVNVPYGRYGQTITNIQYEVVYQSVLGTDFCSSGVNTLTVNNSGTNDQIWSTTNTNGTNIKYLGNGFNETINVITPCTINKSNFNTNGLIFDGNTPMNYFYKGPPINVTFTDLGLYYWMVTMTITLTDNCGNTSTSTTTVQY